jgi:alpha-D-ribose 1-methylphosphonate 5-triphosphate synthase subunit PhnG
MATMLAEEYDFSLTQHGDEHVIKNSFSDALIFCMKQANTQEERARWMSLLAKAPNATLTHAVRNYGTLPSFVWLRRPETGLAMVRARTGGSGTQFNLGEMSVTRCALRLNSGEMGVSYISGRNIKHAEWAAVFDALMQSEHADRVADIILAPIGQALAERQAQITVRAEEARVDFLTMVRGENV